jgi:hypothetical protein
VLSKDEYLKEKSTIYTIKKYHYFYLNEKDKSEENMNKTYIRYNLHETGELNSLEYQVKNSEENEGRLNKRIRDLTEKVNHLGLH